MDLARHFSPFESFATTLATHVNASSTDASHDQSHVLRVWRNVRAISAVEGGDAAILAAATLLHDCVDVPKDAPERSSASRIAAEKSRGILGQLGWTEARIQEVCHAIEAHSFSAAIVPETLEAKILQDADRLDAIGHIGIARCFYVSGRLGRALYDPTDAAAERRALDDMEYAIDHFQTKLLKLCGSFQTVTGQQLAEERHVVVQAFLNGFLAEVSA